MNLLKNNGFLLSNVMGPNEICMSHKQKWLDARDNQYQFPLLPKEIKS